MSCASPIPSHTSSNSSIASLSDQSTRALQSTFHSGDPQHKPSSPSMTSLNSSQSSILNSSTKSDISDENVDRKDPHLPRATATKRDKLVGNAEKVVSKIIRDPELHERAMLRAAGGKELAEGLAVVDSKTL